MSEPEQFITLEIKLPSGNRQQVTAPALANVQQFIDSLVTRLDLPVVREDGVAIHYRLDDAETGTPIDELQNVLESGLLDGSQLALIPHNGSGLTIPLDPPAAKPSPISEDGEERSSSKVRQLLLDAGFWQSLIALAGGLFILVLTIRLRNLLCGITSFVIIIAAVSVVIYKLRHYDVI